VRARSACVHDETGAQVDIGHDPRPVASAGVPGTGTDGRSLAGNPVHATARPPPRRGEGDGGGDDPGGADPDDGAEVGASSAGGPIVTGRTEQRRRQGAAPPPRGRTVRPEYSWPARPVALEVGNRPHPGYSSEEKRTGTVPPTPAPPVSTGPRSIEARHRAAAQEPGEAGRRPQSIIGRRLRHGWPHEP